MYAIAIGDALPKLKVYLEEHPEHTERYRLPQKL